jgi:hypothetical protein
LNIPDPRLAATSTAASATSPSEKEGALSNVERGIRNPEENQADFVLVNQIAPPQFDLYEPAGYYDRERGVMNFEAIEEAKKKAKSGNLSPEAEAHLNESYPEVRPWNKWSP